MWISLSNLPAPPYFFCICVCVCVCVCVKRYASISLCNCPGAPYILLLLCTGSIRIERVNTVITKYTFKNSSHLQDNSLSQSYRLQSKHRVCKHVLKKVTSTNNITIAPFCLSCCCTATTNQSQLQSQMLEGMC